MKIIYIINSLSKTSIPYRWASYCNSQENNFHIRVFTLRDLLKSLYEVYKSNAIVHGHHVKSMVVFLILNVFFQKKTIYTVHGSFAYLSDFNKKLLKFVFKYSSKLVFVNNVLFDVLPEAYKNIIRDKYEVIFNGVEENYKFKKTNVFKKFNIDKSKINIFHPARFVKEKNHLFFIEAYSLVVKKYNVNLILAGDGPLKKVIQDKIQELNLEDYIQVIGIIDRDEVYSFLEKCNLFIMPSISEGLNVAFLEAISMNTKILVSSIDQFVYPLKTKGLDLSDINVTLVKPLDIKSISMGIISAIEMKKTIKDENNMAFSLKQMFQQYSSIYNYFLK